MFGKVKKILGIEGVKMQIDLNEKFDIKKESISGTIKFTTKTQSTIESISIKVIERYERGRKNNRLIDEYVLGELILQENMSITPDEIIEVAFSCEYVYVQSEIEKMAKDNFFLSGPIAIAKMIKKVKSGFRLEASAEVEGTTLKPHVSIDLMKENKKKS